MDRWAERLSTVAGVLFGVVLLGAFLWIATRGLARPTEATLRERESPPKVGVPPTPIARTENAQIVRVYECYDNGQKMFTDTPCNRNMLTHDVNLTRLNTYKSVPPAPSEVQSPAKAPAVGPKVTQPSSAPSRYECKALEEQKKRIDARMRAGYDAVTGERLRREWHRVDDQYYDLHCVRR